MKTRLGLVMLAVLLPFQLRAQVTQKRDWSRVVCPSSEKLAQELLYAELSGWRTRVAKRSCLEQSRFKYIRVLTQDPSEMLEIPPPLIADEKKPYRITEIKVADDDEVLQTKFEVKFTVYVKENGKVREIHDEFSFRRYEGDSKLESGCAGMIVEPETYFIRSSCLREKKDN